MVEYPEDYQRLQLRLAEADQRDLLHAAESVVDAAIWKRRFGSGMIDGNGPISEETRAALVQLVLDDPSMTPYLFTDEAWERH